VKKNAQDIYFTFEPHVSFKMFHKLTVAEIYEVLIELSFLLVSKLTVVLNLSWYR
jgi:hypothetical protein